LKINLLLNKRGKNMFKKVLSLMLVLCMVFTLAALTGCQDKDKSTDDKIKVGFIYVGPKNDGGWTEAHDIARQEMEKELGVETVYKESVPEEKGECAKQIENLISQGCNVIFTTSYGFMEATVEKAKEHPDVKFFHCSGDQRLDNLSTYFGRIEEPRYLSGIVAGLKTKSNKIGYVAAMQIPEVIRGINAFTLGVQSVNKDAKVIVKWSNTWIDETLEKEAAIALLDEGCDVIAQHNDSTAPQLAAQERGAFAIGYDLDARDVATKAYMTAPVFNWAPYYIDQVKAIMDGTWKSSDYLGGMKEGVVDLAELTENAPEGAKEKVEEVEKQIVDGKFTIFKGPLKDQSGTIRVEEGKEMTADEIWNMNWFIEGVEGKLDK